MKFHFGYISKWPDILVDMCRHFISSSVYMIFYHTKRNFISVKMTHMKSIPALSSITSIYKILYCTVFSMWKQMTRPSKPWDFANLPLRTLFRYYLRMMKYAKYATFNCQGLNDDNKKSSLADDFLHDQITVMILQETRTTG